MKAGRSNRTLVVFLVALVVVIAYLAVWRPRANDLADIRSSRDARTEELAALNAGNAATTPSTVAGTTETWEAAIPSTPQLPNLLRQLQEIASEAGVDQKTVTPSPLAANGGAPGASMPVTISVVGPKAAVSDYVHRLSALERLFVVDKLSLQPSDPNDSTGGAFQVDITGRAFTSATTSVTEASHG